MISLSIAESSSLKLLKYLYSAHTNAWYVLNGGSELFFEDEVEEELRPGGHGSVLCPVTSSMNLWRRDTAWPYAATCSRMERKQFCNSQAHNAFVITFARWCSTDQGKLDMF